MMMEFHRRLWAPCCSMTCDPELKSHIQMSEALNIVLSIFLLVYIWLTSLFFFFFCNIVQKWQAYLKLFCHQ